MTNYASTNEPENYEPMTIIDPQGMEASVSDYMQSDEYKRKLAERQANMSENSKTAQEFNTVTPKTWYKVAEHVATGRCTVHYKNSTVINVKESAMPGYMSCEMTSAHRDHSKTVALLPGTRFQVLWHRAVVASAPASTERLEDLSEGQRNWLLSMSDINPYIIYKPMRDELTALGLITTDDEGASIRNERGAALVRDYQRRQAINHAYEAVERTRAERQPAEYVGEHQMLKAQRRIAALEAENARLQSELDAARSDMQALRDEVLALKVENRRVWDGFSVYYKVTGFEPTKRKVYIKGTVHGQSLLANDDDGTYTALYTLANEYASKKIEFGWVD